MRIVFAAVLFATVVFAETPTASGPDLPGVLARLGQKLATQKNQLASVDVTVTGRQEELDSKGKAEHVTESVVKTTHENGQVQHQVVKATQDGNDITEQMQKQMRVAMRDEGDAHAENPFEPGLQAAYRFTRAGSGPKGEWIVHFEPAQAGPTRIRGDALIDPASADLVRLTAEPVERPSHMDKVQLVEEYGQKSPWGNLRSKMTMQAEGSIFWLVHRRVRGVAEFAYDLPK
jgi:hypothetical protein